MVSCDRGSNSCGAQAPKLQLVAASAAQVPVTVEGAGDPGRMDGWNVAELELEAMAMIICVATQCLGWCSSRGALRGQR